MKRLLPALLMLLSFTMSSWAKDPVAGGQSVFIGGSGHPPPVENCVVVEIGGETTPSFACVNERWQQEVEQVRPVENIPALDARSPAVNLHGFNETALQQQYGPSFGKSAVPFRPAAPVFVNPLGPR